jgi:hypothetical protein
MKPTFIIAGNYSLYKNYLKENNLNQKDYQYLNSIEKIIGYRNPTIVLADGYYEQTKLLADLNQRGIDPLKLPFVRGKK